MGRSRNQLVALLGLMFALLPPVAFGAEAPRVTAVLSNSQAQVGEMVQMQIRITGARGAQIPDISVDGLEIHQTGSSQQFEMRNFDMTQSVTYSFTILPLKPGGFTIPPQKIKVGSTTLETPELRLAVVGSGGTTARPSQGSQSSRGSGGNNADDAQTTGGKLAFVDLIVTKKAAYVGEMIPVEIRVGFNSRSHGRPLEPPELSSQGFTMQKVDVPDQPRIQTIDGRTYEVWSFKTAIAATRAGNFDIGPAQIGALVAVPKQRQQNSRPRSPFDLFNMDDPFSDPSFQDPFGYFTTMQRATLKSDPVHLEVKALPPNAPADFSGAVGNFSLTGDANPKSVQVGDPVTLTATISGKGNFDRVSAPTLEDEHGWHKYPPSAKFKQDDTVGFSGTKSFEMVVSPNEKKTNVPPLRFTFFDPLKEQYVTLKTDALPIKVEGGSMPSVAAAGPSATAAPARTTPATSAEPPVAATPAPQDILYQVTEWPARPGSFVPLYRSNIFLGAQLLPLAALLGYVGWKLRQRRLLDREARRTAALHHEANDLVRALKRDGVSPQEYYTRASQAIRVKTALALKIDPNVVDLDDVIAAFHLDEASRNRLQRLFEQTDELKYSGGGNGTQTIAPEQRRETLELIESLRA